ncbi:hypothetical protein C3B44_03335 [Corynebacterium yudongzhengii]|uniref:Cardiolipin synthase N-terminal domain-containing protein n=1 Tax=Corynebacterium yudongzhengii TaxID=2080740 RepID=A0A2U1T7E3_9CORY|nr:hypothetical protein [Corynebacterium yudongzhengii]AWB81505.1 hypothetical protein C3B44_03335 [Corynebacterium yudongzhengii]PWC01924.1 hypothetical protein DF222_04910 [Corynebacterium yudongzhengii]
MTGTEDLLLIVLVGGGLLILATLVGALIVHKVEQKRGTYHLERVKWTVIVASVPLLGFLLWLFFRSSRDPDERTNID